MYLPVGLHLILLEVEGTNILDRPVLVKTNLMWVLLWTATTSSDTGQSCPVVIESWLVKEVTQGVSTRLEENFVYWLKDLDGFRHKTSKKFQISFLS